MAAAEHSPAPALRSLEASIEMDRPRSESESDESSPDEVERLVLPGLGDAAERVRDVEALAAAPPLPCPFLL